jgi:acyl-[acyl carrier protein]--UDP-N-acetylglucosamine O-acyltransferase
MRTTHRTGMEGEHMKKRNMTRKDSIALDKTSKQIREKKKTVLDDQALDEVQQENKKLNEFMQQFLPEPLKIKG